VQLSVRLPSDVASEAEEAQRSDPDFLSRVIQYGLTRRSIYRGLRDAETAKDSLMTAPPDATTGFIQP